MRCDANRLSSLNPSLFIPVQHGVRNSDGAAKHDPRKKFDVSVANFSRIDRTTPKNTVIGYAVRNSLALTVPFRVTGIQYVGVFLTSSTANPDAPLTPPSSLPQSDGASSSATPPPWYDELDLPRLPDTNYALKYLASYTSMPQHEKVSLGTIKAKEQLADLEQTRRLVHSI